MRYLALAGALAISGVIAASAFAFVDIYTNPFSKQSDYRELKTLGSPKKCDRSLQKKKGVLKVTVKGGPRSCLYKIPVQGDGPKPDHRFDAQGRILKSTKSNIRDEAYLSLSIRVGGGNRYELRVFPKGKNFVLSRQPTGPGFPVNGSNPAIGKPGEKNKMRLVAVGDNVKAFVNGTKVADVTDGNANQISGDKLDFGVGSLADTRKKVTAGNFDRLKLSVPNP